MDALQHLAEMAWPFMEHHAKEELVVHQFLNQYIIRFFIVPFDNCAHIERTVTRQLSVQVVANGYH